VTAVDRLAEIKGRAEAATAGPWKLRLNRAGNGMLDTPVSDAEWNANQPANIAFIGHSRTDVPALASALRAVLSLHSEYRTPLTGRISCCAGCNLAYPCPTVTAIAIALTSEETS